LGYHGTQANIKTPFSWIERPLVPVMLSWQVVFAWGGSSSDEWLAIMAFVVIHPHPGRDHVCWNGTQAAAAITEAGTRAGRGR
jgi:hypothetical protein